VKVGGNHLVEQEGLTGAFNQYVWSTPSLQPAQLLVTGDLCAAFMKFPAASLQQRWTPQDCLLHCRMIEQLSDTFCNHVTGLTLVCWTDIALCLHTSQISNGEYSWTWYWSQCSLWLCMTNLTVTRITISITKQEDWCRGKLLCSEDTRLDSRLGYRLSWLT
jgi:hypothetical protein